MKIQALEYFITLSESQSINEAAQKLYVTQPSLTKSLKAFEKEIGMELFHRTKAGIELTESGKKVLPEAKAIMEYYNGWVSMGKTRELKELDIYIHTSFPNFLLPEIVFQFKKKYPDFHINCRETLNPERYITQDTEKAVLVLLPCVKGKEYNELIEIQGNNPITLFNGQYVCLIRKDNPLAKKKEVSIDDLKGYYLALPDGKVGKEKRYVYEDMAIGEFVKEIQKHGSEYVFYVDSVNSVIDIVKHHDNAYALSYYPALYRYSYVDSKEMVFVPFTGIDMKSCFSLFYSKTVCEKYPVLREFISLVREAADNFIKEHKIEDIM